MEGSMHDSSPHSSEDQQIQRRRGKLCKLVLLLAAAASLAVLSCLDAASRQRQLLARPGSADGVVKG